MPLVPPPPLAKATLDLLGHMITDRTAWDELPDVGLLKRPLAADSLRVPDVMWAQHEDPKKVLLEMIRDLKASALGVPSPTRRLLRDCAPSGVYGVYVRIETWGPPRYKAEEVGRAIRRGGAVLPFAGMKDRVEGRLAAAIDSAGCAYWASMERGSPDVTAIYDDKITNPNISGKIRTILTDLLAEIAKVPGEPAPNAPRRQR